jgi:signal transduction histidine kinase
MGSDGGSYGELPVGGPHRPREHDIRISPLFLERVVERYVARQQSIAATHRFHLELNDLPPVVVANTAAMEQVFTNLISNAVKYAPVAPDISGQRMRDCDRHRGRH